MKQIQKQKTKRKPRETDDYPTNPVTGERMAF